MREGVIFDLDGTIINSAEDIVDSLRLAYLENRIRVDRDLNNTCIGPPLKDMICALTPRLTQEQVSGVIHSFRRIYDTGSYAKTKLYDGIREVVKQLARRNIPLFIATNKPKHAAMSLLRKFELSGFLLEVMTPDSNDGVAFSKSAMLNCLKLKWNLHTPYFVGDSAEDILAARENNLRSIAVLYGYGKKDSLLAAKPHYIVDTATGILSIILNNSKSEGTL
jgi:phosphoglycolate phosphatase